MRALGIQPLSVTLAPAYHCTYSFKENVGDEIVVTPILTKVLEFRFFSGKLTPPPSRHLHKGKSWIRPWTGRQIFF